MRSRALTFTLVAVIAVVLLCALVVPALVGVAKLLLIIGVVLFVALAAAVLGASLRRSS